MNNCYPFFNTPLPYPAGALEPYLEERTMEFHHGRHLRAYIDALNTLLEENPPLQNWTLQQLVQNWRRLPAALREPVRRNAGGVYNHRFYFDSLCGECPPGESGKRAQEVIAARFGGLGRFQERMKEAGLSVFGSGYAWLILERCRLEIVTTANQDTPLLPGCRPLLNADVWEHAYYLQYQNRRGDYLDNWFHIINWEQVWERMQPGSVPPAR